MLYVFIVSTGTTMKFQMNLAVKKVSELKIEISKCVPIPVEDLVLLCSGGEELRSEIIVGNYYGAGTDTNPIFLFSKSDYKLPFNEGPTSIDLSLINDVKACASMSPSLEALSVRASLAEKLKELASKYTNECNELVHQQHRQQQGWAAVIANLEDAKDSLLKRKHHFDELFEKYLSNRYSYQETIKMFPDDIVLLSKVPLLPKILLGSECSKEDLEAEHTLLSWFCNEPQQVLESLVEKCQRSLDELNETSLIALNEDFMQVLRSAENPDVKEVRGIEERLSSLNKQIEGAEQLRKDQKEIKAIFSLDLIHSARDPNVLPDVSRTLQTQLDLMLENHISLVEILKKCKNAKVELSESINARIKYICQLESDMYDLQVRMIFLEKHVESVVNHIKNFHQVHLAPHRYLKMLAEVYRRKEFSTNFLKWTSELSEKASKLYHKEITLRRSFSSEESKNMVDNLFPGMNDEPPKFAVECPLPFDQNLPNICKEDLDWLKTLFPELSHLCEVPPPEPMPYMSQAESDSAFSSNIPSSLKISSLETSQSNILKVHAKISALQKFIRELQGSLQSDLSNLKEFVKDEMSERMSDASHVVEKINAYVRILHEQMLLEKEEAISEAKKDFVSIENAYIHRLEVESQKLNDAENKIADYEEHEQTIKKLERELKDNEETLKHIMLEHELEFDSYKNEMKVKLQSQEAADIELRQTISNALCEIEKLKQDNAGMQSDYNETLEKKEAIISDMQAEKKILKEEILRLQESKGASKDLSELEMKLRLTVNEKAQCMKELEEAQLNLNKLKAEADKRKQSALKELEEKLTSKHKNDMESLRSRFKLAVSTTSIDRLPSPSSTEPLDDESLIGMEVLRKVMIENKEKLEAEKQRAVKEVQTKMLETVNKMRLNQEEEKSLIIATLQSDHEEALERFKSRITAENQVSFNEAINRLAKEKDAIIEDLRSQKSVLIAKQFAIKAHLDKYTSSQYRPGEGDAMSQSDSGCSCGNADLHRGEEGIFLLKLRQEFEPGLREGTESQSLYLCSQSALAHESVKKKHKTKEEECKQVPIQHLESSQLPCLDCKTKFSVLTCNEDDLVLVYYEDRHQNYAIFHKGPFAHFLHSDCLQPLKLKLPAENPNETIEDSSKSTLAVVTFKEFCVIKKKENRYNAPPGTKFYRVKVKPFDINRAITQIQLRTQVKSTMNALQMSNSQLPSNDGDGKGGGGFSGMSASAL